MILPLPSTYDSVDLQLGRMCRYVWCRTGTAVHYWYTLCVYGMRFPMEHLRLLHYMVFLYSLNVDVFVHVSISMVTVPLL